MLRRLVISLVLLMVLSTPTWAATVTGGTGLVFVPEAATLATGELEASAHAFDEAVVLSLNVGLFKQVELGLYTNFDRVGYTLKGVLNPESAAFPGIAIGVESGDVYIALTRSFARLRGTLGLGTGAFDGLFGGVSYQLNPIKLGKLQPAPLLMLEYDGHWLNGGVRLDLLPQLELDINLYDGGHPMFGLSYKAQF